jgi:hypothetical protein
VQADAEELLSAFVDLESFAASADEGVFGGDVDDGFEGMVEAVGWGAGGGGDVCPTKVIPVSYEPMLVLAVLSRRSRSVRASAAASRAAVASMRVVAGMAMSSA